MGTRTRKTEKPPSVSPKAMRARKRREAAAANDPLFPRTQGGDTKFKEGEHHGGKPRGPSKTTQVLNIIGTDASGDIIRAMVRKAKAGNVEAASLILARTWKIRRGSPIPIRLPDIKTPQDLIAAFAAVGKAISEQLISPEEGAAVCQVLSSARAAFDSITLSDRVAALELAALGQDKGSS